MVEVISSHEGDVLPRLDLFAQVPAHEEIASVTVDGAHDKLLGATFMARDFDRQTAELHIRNVILNRFKTSGSLAHGLLRSLTLAKGAVQPS